MSELSGYLDSRVSALAFRALIPSGVSGLTVRTESSWLGSELTESRLDSMSSSISDLRSRRPSSKLRG